MLKLLSVALLPWLLFNIIYWPLEYLLIQRLFYSEKIIPTVSTILIVILIVVSGLMYLKRLLPTSFGKLFLIVIIFLSLAAGSYHFFYRLTRDFYQYPSIHELKPTWGIQDTIIVIRGDRFMNEGQKGKVFFGEEELLIDRWEDQRIIGHLPVPKNNSFKVGVYLIRADGKQSNMLEFFYLADPDEIEKLAQ